MGIHGKRTALPIRNDQKKIARRFWNSKDLEKHKAYHPPCVPLCTDAQELGVGVGEGEGYRKLVLCSFFSQQSRLCSPGRFERSIPASSC